MIHVSIQHKQYRNYTQTSNCIITGEAFYQNQLYKDNDLLQLINLCEIEEQFVDRLKQLNGFYALVKHTDQQLFAAVDRVRSIPLFYGQKGTEFYLSDSAEWVRQQVRNIEMDPLAREEFLLTGYITGPDTLFPDVKQLQAGEALIVSDNNTKLSVSVKRYYCFIHQNTLEASEGKLLSKLDKVLINVFQRLIMLADGRTLVVPLSGGYDSRLIVLMLKRLGYDNVITFSYGRPGNKESKISKKIAETLNMRWEFIPYSNKAWYKWFHSEERKKYWSMAGTLCTLPHNQDWPAVWDMKRQGIIPDDSIFVPGHTVTLTLNGIPKDLNQASLINSIINKHYSLSSRPKRHKEILLKLKREIHNIKSYSIRNSFCANSIDIFESWEYQERQCKFIINSVRVYEYWGYQWWLPLWDSEFTETWSRISIKYRLDKNIYRKYVNKLYKQLTGVDNSLVVMNLKQHASISYMLYKLLKRVTPLYFLIQLIYNNNKTLTDFDKHPLAAWGRYARTKKEYLKTCYGMKNPLSMNTFIYIKQISQQPNKNNLSVDKK